MTTTVVHKNNYLKLMENKGVYSFPEGIPGFEEVKSFEFIRFESSEGKYISMLSMNNPANKDTGVMFLCIDPLMIRKDYKFKLSYEEKLTLENNSLDDLITLCIVMLNKNKSMTANMVGPIVLDIKSRKGLQSTPMESNYKIRHKVKVSKIGKL